MFYRYPGIGMIFEIACGDIFNMHNFDTVPFHGKFSCQNNDFDTLFMKIGQVEIELQLYIFLTLGVIL